MTAAKLPHVIDRVVAFLGDLGPRWGLSAAACRVHGYLYLCARSVAGTELRKRLNLSEGTLQEALAWLEDYRLVRADGDAWRTDSDPWDLMLRALEERQRREVGPALDLLRECHEIALRERGPDRVAAAQIGKLLRLAEDLAAINTQAQRLSPRALRQLVGLGGLAGRFIDRTFGGRSRT
jgi:DNA-binding transcriptional regulator GbsR (MarR family)